MNKRTLKWILIGAGALVVSAALAFAILLLFVKEKPNVSTATLKTDTSKDFGACNLVEKSLIKSILGAPAKNLQGPDNMGLVYLSGNNQTQKCVYSFTDGGTMDNSFHASNGFSIEIYIHPNQADSDSTNKLYSDAKKEQVASLGDAAYFDVTSRTTTKDGSASDGISQKDTIKNTIYTLTVFSGIRHYDFTVSQPTTDESFDHDKALDALKKIAESAELSKQK